MLPRVTFSVIRVGMCLTFPSPGGSSFAQRQILGSMYSQPLTIRFGTGEVSLVLGRESGTHANTDTEKVIRGNMCAPSFTVAFINRSSQVDSKRVGETPMLSSLLMIATWFELGVDRDTSSDCAPGGGEVEGVLRFYPN